MVADARLVKKGEGVFLAPGGERKPVLVGCAMRFQEVEIALRQDVAVNVNHEAFRLSRGAAVRGWKWDARRSHHIIAAGIDGRGGRPSEGFVRTCCGNELSGEKLTPERAL